MSRRPCSACGEPFQKGKRRGVVDDSGTIEVSLICSRCVRRCFAVCTRIGKAANKCTMCKERPARICSECARKARVELVAPVLAQLRGLVKAHDMNGQEEKAEALRGAMRALEQEAERG